MSEKNVQMERVCVWLLGTLVVGFAVGWFAKDLFFSPIPSLAPTFVRENSSSYRFINPLLTVRTNKSLYTAEFKPLVASITSYIDAATRDDGVQSASIYFQDLNDGHWTGVNENDLYTPASMLKVLTLMATLKLAESDPSIMQERLYYDASSSPFVQYYLPDDGLSNGYYGIQSLVRYMIVYSDNNALAALLTDKSISDEFTDVYDVFRLPQASSTDQGNFMSPRSYSVLFRALYNSTFFEWGLSEQVLGLLSQTDFTKGIVAGVPSGVAIAHKFGENSTVSSDGTIVDRELHDCGIVYYPGRPYLICIMTKGNDFPTLETVISGMSKLVYDYVASTTPTGD